MNGGSKLLIDEHPLQVLPTLAALIGLNEAIVLQQVHYWLKISEKAKDEYKHRDGSWWTYGSVKEWQVENFPFWSESTVQRTFANLEKLGLLVSKKFNAATYDHTKWYTVDYQRLNGITEPTSMDESITSNCGNRLPKDDAILINTETSTETSSETSSSKGFEFPEDFPPEEIDEPQPTPYEIFVQKLTKDYPSLAFSNGGQGQELGQLFDAYGEKTLLSIAAWMNASANKLTSMPQYLRFASSKAKGWNTDPQPPKQPQPRYAQPPADKKAYHGPNGEIVYM